jgi:hypothetical protein
MSACYNDKDDSFCKDRTFQYDMVRAENKE